MSEKNIELVKSPQLKTDLTSQKDMIDLIPELDLTGETKTENEKPKKIIYILSDNMIKLVENEILPNIEKELKAQSLLPLKASELPKVINIIFESTEKTLVTVQKSSQAIENSAENIKLTFEKIIQHILKKFICNNKCSSAHSMMIETFVDLSIGTFLDILISKSVLFKKIIASRCCGCLAATLSQSILEHDEKVKE